MRKFFAKNLRSMKNSSDQSEGLRGVKFCFIFLALFFCIIVEVLQKELLIKKKSDTMVILFSE